MKVKYFAADGAAIAYAYGAPRRSFLAMGGRPSKHNYFDGFRRLVGDVVTEDGARVTVPVARKIFYKSRPSLHKCDGRCVNAKGHDCECACGGHNHGRGNA